MPELLYKAGLVQRRVATLAERVLGNAYVGTRYSFGQGRFSNYDGAIGALHGISAGREVVAYYDPVRPQRAVSRKG